MEPAPTEPTDRRRADTLLPGWPTATLLPGGPTPGHVATLLPGGPTADHVATLLPGGPPPASGPATPRPVAETLLPGGAVPGPGRVGTLLPGDAGMGPAPAASQAPRYTLARLHAEGGLGRVWIARDGDLNREVALKEIKSGIGGAMASRRFLREAQVTGQLEHPNIVPVYELGRRPEDGQPFYTMRLLRGRTFREAIAEHHRDRPGTPPDPLGLQRLLTSFVAICQAVAYAHSRGVIHRDLKPENVVVGGFGEVVVLDWGLAKVVGMPDDPVAGPAGGELPLPDLVLSPEASALSTVGAAGTPSYMAPEQASHGGTIDERTDIYGLGGILFEILTGRPPAEGRDLAEVLRAVVEGPTPMARQLAPGVPKPLEAVAAKALAKPPGGRYARASDLADDVQRWIAGEPVSAWPEPWTVRARRWVRKHRVLVTSGSAAALVALLAGSIKLATDRSHGLGLVDTLEDAQIDRVPSVVEQVEGYRAWADPRLRADFEARGDGSDEKLRAGLGLLPVAPGVAGFLYGRLLGADAPTVRVVREALGRGHREAIARRAESDWDGLDPDRRFRAACVLAAFAPDSARWDPAGAWVVDHLMGLNRVDPVSVGAWSSLLAPALHRVVPAMTAAYTDPARDAADRALAARLLAAHARKPEDLCLLVQVADDRDFETFLARLRENPGRAGDLLAAEVASAGGDPRRRAQAALALTKLGRPGAAWPLLGHSPDPSARSWLIDRLGSLGDGPVPLLDRLEVEPDASARRAIVQALGGIPVDRVPPSRREAAIAGLLGRFRADPDPGMHSALDGLLRRWGRGADVRKVESELAGKPPGERGWLVGPGGATFSIVRGPVEFAMGSPEAEADRQDIEPRHRRTIGRSFAIATREVTVAEFLEFVKARPGLLPEGQEYLREFSPEPECPINGTSWLNAVLFCRWLGEREGLAEDRQCYPPIDALIKAAEMGAVDVIRPDYLEKPGYRLPTEAEWEYACRAGSTASRHFGEGLALLPRYAWHPANSGNRTHPVGSLLPNDLGLFDAAGNIREWCHGPLRAYPEAGSAGPDAPFAGPIEIGEQQPVRGGSFLDLPAMTRSAHRNAYTTIGRQASCGLRVARTLP